MRTITVRVPPKLNLEQAQKVLTNVLGKAGHPNCFSGFDIRFAEEIEYSVNAGNLEVREAGH